MIRSRATRLAPWALALLVLASPAAAFHDAGVANCGGCHVMHGGAVFPPNPVDGGLLSGESPSDVCLVCHAANAGAALGSDPLVPPPERGAGNFVFLLEDNINDGVGGAADPISGEEAGHSIYAPSHGLVPDSLHFVAPGGSFPSDRLGCTSCHNPHGNAKFRMLNDVGPVQSGLAEFVYPAPSAEGIDIDAGVESNASHTAYLAGMSAWCANCHGRYHQMGVSAFQHPSGQTLGSEIATRYDLYDGDDAPTGGDAASAYLAAVSFEEMSATTQSTAGPSATAGVMCLTCHRAHASSAPHAGRWDFNVSLLSADGVVSGSWPIPSPYGDPNQTGLCAKCHGPLPGVGGSEIQGSTTGGTTGEVSDITPP